MAFVKMASFTIKQRVQIVELYQNVFNNFNKTYYRLTAFITHDSKRINKSHVNSPKSFSVIMKMALLVKLS